MASPTQRSKKHMEQLGYTVAIVEKWNQYAGIRQDLYGFIDLLCMKAGAGFVGVQTTSTRVKERIDKINASPLAKIFLAAGGRIICHGWSLKGKAGKRKTYQLREVEIGNELPAQYKEKQTDHATKDDGQASLFKMPQAD